jgi:hypothetical protein
MCFKYSINYIVETDAINEHIVTLHWTVCPMFCYEVDGTGFSCDPEQVQ